MNVPNPLSAGTHPAPSQQAPPRASAMPPTNPAAHPSAPSTSRGGNTASPSGSHPTNHHAPNDGIINKTLFKCRKCKLLFWTTREAATHEQSCNDLSWVNCKVCQVLRFRSKEERAVHERTCSGPMPLRIADLPLAERIVHHTHGDGAEGGGSLNRGGGGVRSSPSAPAAGGATAGAGPVSGSAFHQVARTHNNAQAPPTNQGPKAAIKNEKVQSIIERYKNEVRRGSTQEPETSMTAVNDDESDSSVEIIEPPAKPRNVQQLPPQSAVASSTKNMNVDPPSSTNSVSTASEKSSNVPTKKKDMEWTTVWTCDVCQEEQFDKYEDAEAHEKICKGPKSKEKPQDPSLALASSGKAVQDLTPAKASTPTAAASSTNKPSPPKSVSPSNKAKATKPLFSPMLKDGSDSPNYHQLSKFHRLALKSIQLCYQQRPSSPQLICVNCLHCNNFLALNTQTTIKKVAELLPQLVLAHNLECNAVLNAEKVKMTSAGTVGKMPFEDFLAGFFKENGIVENASGIVALNDDEFLKLPGIEKSKRFIQLNAGKKKRGRPATTTTTAKPSAKRRRSSKTTESPGDKSTPRPKHKDLQFGDMGCKMHNEEGTIFTLGPLDGLPFITSFSREAAKKLLQPHRFMLQQMELFAMSSKLIESTKMNCSPDSVGIRCRHCIADKNGCCFMKLSSVNNLSRDVMVMAMEHIVSCKFMKAKDAKVIQEVKRVDNDYMNKYCNWIASLYCLEDSKPGKLPGVVLGESPKVTGGYSTPADVDVSSVLGRPMPNLVEAETPPPKVAEKESSSMAQPLAKAVGEVQQPGSVGVPVPALASTHGAQMVDSSADPLVLNK